MISHIEGKIVLKEIGYIVVSVSGIGYKVHVAGETAKQLLKEGEGKNIKLWTHLAVRENSQDLYGFADRDELGFFELLIGIPGIGPKSALAILSLATVKTLRAAIASGDTSYLTKVSGIGRKNSEKIVLELKDKLGDEFEASLPKEEAEALEALKALGYSAKDARDALKEVDSSVSGAGERVKAALKSLSTG